MNQTPTQIQAYPLTWPDTMPRRTNRDKGAFKTGLNTALKNVNDSLRLFGQDAGKPVSNIVISSNVSLGISNPADPGVAAWFVWEGQQLCIPVDRYASVEANLQAIHHILEARRVELRHGTLNLVRASFRGFQALPAPPGSHWTEVLGLPLTATKAEIEAAYREKAKASGGNEEALYGLNDAKTKALKQIGGK